MERIQVTLPPDEYTALTRLCEDDIRSPSDSLRHLLREEIQRRRRAKKFPTEEGPLTERQRLVMCAFWSVSKSKRPTLEEVAKRFGYCRERVRTMQRSAIQALWNDYLTRL